MSTPDVVPGAGGYCMQGSGPANSVLHFRGIFAAPPTFTETPPQYIEAKEGGSVTMTCTAFGNPKPIVTWLKEGTLLGASGKYQVRVFLPWGRCPRTSLPTLPSPLSPTSHNQERSVWRHRVRWKQQADWLGRRHGVHVVGGRWKTRCLPRYPPGA